MTDETMAAVVEAVSARDADTLIALWAGVGPMGDPLHRCTIAHYLADLFDDPAESLMWDVRALDAAEVLTDERARQFDESLDVRGFFASLHLNLADDLRRLGSFDAAARELDVARARVDVLADDAYGEVIRTGVDGVAADIAARSTERRATH